MSSGYVHPLVIKCAPSSSDLSQPSPGVVDVVSPPLAPGKGSTPSCDLTCFSPVAPGSRSCCDVEGALQGITVRLGSAGTSDLRDAENIKSPSFKSAKPQSDTEGFSTGESFMNMHQSEDDEQGEAENNDAIEAERTGSSYSDHILQRVMSLDRVERVTSFDDITEPIRSLKRVKVAKLVGISIIAPVAASGCWVAVAVGCGSHNDSTLCRSACNGVTALAHGAFVTAVMSHTEYYKAVDDEQAECSCTGASWPLFLFWIVFSLLCVIAPLPIVVSDFHNFGAETSLGYVVGLVVCVLFSEFAFSAKPHSYLGRCGPIILALCVPTLQLLYSIVFSTYFASNVATGAWFGLICLAYPIPIALLKKCMSLMLSYASKNESLATILGYTSLSWAAVPVTDT